MTSELMGRSPGRVMNSTSVEFCDTNVLLYAHDVTAGAKQDRALVLLQHLWATGNGAVSIQVLQELYVGLTRKLSPPVTVAAAREIVESLSAWRVVRPGSRDVLAAIDAGQRWQISYWDAMVLTTARLAGATVLWSEDLNAGQNYDGVVVRNPFAAIPPA